MRMYICTYIHIGIITQSPSASASDRCGQDRHGKHRRNVDTSFLITFPVARIKRNVGKHGPFAIIYYSVYGFTGFLDGCISWGSVILYWRVWWCLTLFCAQPVREWIVPPFWEGLAIIPICVCVSLSSGMVVYFRYLHTFGLVGGGLHMFGYSWTPLEYIWNIWVYLEHV